MNLKLTDFPPQGRIWLFLVHQLPAKPAYFRVKIWRRLQQLGAVALKKSVYALPSTLACRESFEWLRKEIVDGGAEAVLVEGWVFGGVDDAQLETRFRDLRASDFAEIIRAARKLRQKGGTAVTEIEALRKRLAVVVAIDFWGAPGRDAATEAVQSLEAKMAWRPGSLSLKPDPTFFAKQGRIWVTRRHVGVDRMACTWLIRRFLDPGAKFKFVEEKSYKPGRGEVRFDTFEGEFTHEGDLCTFEVLLLRAALKDKALKKIADSVHELDVMDGKFPAPEAAGLKALMAGIEAAHSRDEKRLEHSYPVFEALYNGFK